MLENMIYLGLDHYLQSDESQWYEQDSEFAKHYAVVIADLQKVKNSLSYNPARNTEGRIFDAEKLKMLRNQLSPSVYLERALKKEKNSILKVLRDWTDKYYNMDRAFDANNIDLSQSRVQIFEGSEDEMVVTFRLQNKRYEVLASLFFALVFMGVTIGVEIGDISAEWVGGAVFIPGMNHYVVERGFESQLLKGLQDGHSLEDLFDYPGTTIFSDMKEHFLCSVTNSVNQLEDVDVSAFLSTQVVDYLSPRQT